MPDYGQPIENDLNFKPIIDFFRGKKGKFDGSKRIGKPEMTRRTPEQRTEEQDIRSKNVLGGTSSRPDAFDSIQPGNPPEKKAVDIEQAWDFHIPGRKKKEPKGFGSDVKVGPRPAPRIISDAPSRTERNLPNNKKSVEKVMDKPEDSQSQIPHLKIDETQLRQIASPGTDEIGREPLHRPAGYEPKYEEEQRNMPTREQLAESTLNEDIHAVPEDRPHRLRNSQNKAIENTLLKLMKEGTPGWFEEPKGLPARPDKSTFSEEDIAGIERDEKVTFPRHPEGHPQAGQWTGANPKSNYVHDDAVEGSLLKLTKADNQRFNAMAKDKVKEAKKDEEPYILVADGESKISPTKDSLENTLLKLMKWAPYVDSEGEQALGGGGGKVPTKNEMVEDISQPPHEGMRWLVDPAPDTGSSRVNPAVFPGDEAEVPSRKWSEHQAFNAPEDADTGKQFQSRRNIQNSLLKLMKAEEKQPRHDWGRPPQPRPAIRTDIIGKKRIPRKLMKIDPESRKYQFPLYPDPGVRVIGRGTSQAMDSPDPTQPETQTEQWQSEAEQRMDRRTRGGRESGAMGIRSGFSEEVPDYSRHRSGPSASRKIPIGKTDVEKGGTFWGGSRKQNVPQTPPQQEQPWGRQKNQASKEAGLIRRISRFRQNPPKGGNLGDTRGQRKKSVENSLLKLMKQGNGNGRGEEDFTTLKPMKLPAKGTSRAFGNKPEITGGERFDVNIPPNPFLGRAGKGTKPSDPFSGTINMPMHGDSYIPASIRGGAEAYSTRDMHEYSRKVGTANSGTGEYPTLREHIDGWGRAGQEVGWQFGHVPHNPDIHPRAYKEALDTPTHIKDFVSLINQAGFKEHPNPDWKVFEREKPGVSPEEHIDNWTRHLVEGREGDDYWGIRNLPKEKSIENSLLKLMKEGEITPSKVGMTRQNATKDLEKVNTQFMQGNKAALSPVAPRSAPTAAQSTMGTADQLLEGTGSNVPDVSNLLAYRGLQQTEGAADLASKAPGAALDVASTTAKLGAKGAGAVATAPLKVAGKIGGMFGGGKNGTKPIGDTT